MNKAYVSFSHIYNTEVEMCAHEQKQLGVSISDLSHSMEWRYLEPDITSSTSCSKRDDDTADSFKSHFNFIFLVGVSQRIMLVSK